MLNWSYQSCFYFLRVALRLLVLNTIFLCLPSVACLSIWKASKLFQTLHKVYMVPVVTCSIAVFVVNYFVYSVYRYFQCEPTFGLFAPLHKIVRSSLPLPIRLQTQLQPENDLQNTLGALGSDSSLNSVASTLSGSSLTPKPATTSTSQVSLVVFA